MSFVNFQNETRNEIVKMNLYMEICSLGVVISACLASFVSMNLTSGLEDHPFAYYIALPMIIILGTLSSSLCIYRFKAITHSEQVPEYPVLRNMFRYFLLPFLILSSKYTSSFLFLFFPVLLSSHHYTSMVGALTYQGLFLSGPYYIHRSYSAIG